jgi:phenylpyruvate tautomerase PptA (4-oxalocrotonate tautomerase family)
MPEILVHIVEGRSPEAKKALMKDITTPSCGISRCRPSASWYRS